MNETENIQCPHCPEPEKCERCGESFPHSRNDCNKKVENLYGEPSSKGKYLIGNCPHCGALKGEYLSYGHYLCSEGCGEIWPEITKNPEYREDYASDYKKL